MPFFGTFDLSEDRLRSSFRFRFASFPWRSRRRLSGRYAVCTTFRKPKFGHPAAEYSRGASLKEKRDKRGLISRPLCARIDEDCAPASKPRARAGIPPLVSIREACAGAHDLISGQLRAEEESNHLLITFSALG